MNTPSILRLVLRNGIRSGPCSFQGSLANSSAVRNAFAVIPLRCATSLSTPKASITNLKMIKAATPQEVSVRHSSSDHVNHWTAERALSVILLGAFPLAIAVPSVPTEAFLALSLCVHSHWGIEAIVHDYVRPSVFGTKIPVIAEGLVYGLSVMTLGSLLYFIYTDVGLVNAVSMLWKV